MLIVCVILPFWERSFPLIFEHDYSFYRKTISRQDLITAPTGSRFQIDVEKNWVESSKVAAVFLELENLCSVGSKSILFSQWTSFLDLLQIPLARYLSFAAKHFLTNSIGFCMKSC